MARRIALFIHQPKCSIQSANGIIRALSPHYEFKIFTRHELEDDFFDDVDIVCFPGGVGDSDSYDWLMTAQQQRIKDFVDRGGRYLGVCMGAYWAGPDYFDLLRGVQVEQYIRRPTTCTRRPHAKHMPISWRGQDQSMYFYDGACMIGGNTTVVARYSNGDPMAIIQDRVGVIGCHPEAEHHWYQSHSWMRKVSYHTQHHLLLDFVNQLAK
jgi:glutamine amidotransferase-like uncharacterized protein